MKCHLLLWCNVLPNAGLDFCATDNFPATLVVFFVSQCLPKKELARMLIHDCKVFKCKLSFKALLKIALINLQVTFSIALSKNYHNSDGARSHPNVLSNRFF